LGDHLNTTRVRIPDTLTTDEWRCIAEFKRRAVELASASLWRSPLGNAKVSLTKEKGFTCEIGALPDEESFRSLLLSFRFFFGNDEPSNLNRVLNILGAHCHDDRLRPELSRLRVRWKHALFRNGLQMRFNGKPLSASRILDLWLNAHYFHSDPEKRRMLETVSRMLTPQFLKFMLVNAVVESSAVVLSTYGMLKDLEIPSTEAP
jgi:hypothetical protein